MQKNLKKLVRAGIIAGLYTALTLLVMPISAGAVQVRISEALTLLPLLFIEAVPALTVGCLLSNLIAGCAPPDIILGSLVTALAGVLTFLVGKMIKKTYLKVFIGGLFPVMLNAFILPLIWIYCYGALEYVYIIQVLLLVAGQGLAVYLLGTPLYLQLNKLKEKTLFS
jgi:uncharacterized membrane protein